MHRGNESELTHYAQLRASPADDWHPYQLSFALAGALVDPDDAHLPEFVPDPTGSLAEVP
ncbi:MAG: hypothetical protein OXD31_17865 [Chloroflexi bacterium]|nr:hypothetical protein [Chloroflexota bacterium]